MRVELVSVAIVPAVLWLSVAHGGEQELMPQGFHEVLQDARTAFDQLDVATEQLDALLAGCTALMEGPTSSPDRAVRDLETSVSDFEILSEELRASFRKMDDRANEFFERWEDSLARMSDIDRTTSTQMRNDLWKRYRRVADDGAISEVELRPIVGDSRKLLDAFASEIDAKGRKTHRASLDALKGRAAKWLARVRVRLQNAEKELRALEAADTGPAPGGPTTEGNRTGMETTKARPGSKKGRARQSTAALPSGRENAEPVRAGGGDIAIIAPVAYCVAGSGTPTRQDGELAQPSRLRLAL